MEQMELLLQFNSHCLDEKFCSPLPSKANEAQKVFNSITHRMAYMRLLAHSQFHSSFTDTFECVMRTV